MVVVVVVVVWGEGKVEKWELFGSRLLSCKVASVNEVASSLRMTRSAAAVIYRSPGHISSSVLDGYTVFKFCCPLVTTSHWLIRPNFELARNIAQYKNESIEERILLSENRSGKYLRDEPTPDLQHPHLKDRQCWPF
jgi:hypothetical protein